MRACGSCRTAPRGRTGGGGLLLARRSGPLDTEQHGVAAVLLGELDPDRLPQRRGEVLADVVGADRQFAVAAVDEDRELYGTRTADVAERVECGTDRAPGEEHVVDQDDETVLDSLTGDLGARQSARGAHPQVVAVHRDVE